jgi:hypothetical protein
MSSKIARKALAPVYRKALRTWRPVILYFGSEHCPACEMAGPVFRQIAEPYRHHAQIYMLSTSELPPPPGRHRHTHRAVLQGGEVAEEAQGNRH